MAEQRNDRGLLHQWTWIGVDEAGRGPLAGPVVVAAVQLTEGCDIDGLDDSKKLDPSIRADLARRIRAQARWTLNRAEPDEIDRVNILWATMAAMTRAVDDYQSRYGKVVPQHVPESLFITSETIGLDESAIFVDGNRMPDGMKGSAVIKGDGKYACIAAASILAKDERDHLMRSLSLKYPEYGFDKHFGYATPEHLAALEKYGPCPIHRKSFAPCQRDDQLCLTFEE